MIILYCAKYLSTTLSTFIWFGYYLKMADNRQNML